MKEAVVLRGLNVTRKKQIVPKIFEAKKEENKGIDGGKRDRKRLNGVGRPNKRETVRQGKISRRRGDIDNVDMTRRQGFRRTREHRRRKKNKLKTRLGRH